MRVKTAILISGRGSNMAAIIEAAKADDFPAQIDLVISNRPGAAGLEKARAENIKALCIDHKAYKTRRAFERAMQKELETANIDLICCAGFMRVLTAKFIENWPDRLLNIHPSLLPKYKGLNTHQRALDAGDAEHGCSVHIVTAELDGGSVIAQARVPIEPSDDIESLQAKVLEKELTLYPQALKQIANDLPPALRT